MNETVTWSINGIDPDVRFVAKQAARLSGMTLGEWLNSIIAEQADKMDADPDNFVEIDSRQAVASRLEKIARQDRRNATLMDRPNATNTFDDEDEIDDEAPLLHRSRIARDPEAERYTRRNNAQTHATDNLVQRRLSNIEEALEVLTANSEDKSVLRALWRLEARMKALADTISGAVTNVEPVERANYDRNSGYRRKA